MKKVFTCKQCTKKFERNVSYSTTAPGQTTTLEFCSYTCSGNSRRTSIDIDCAFCKKVFKVWPSKLKTRKFCSRLCKNKQDSINNRGRLVNPSGIPWNKGLKGAQVPWNKGKPYPQVSGDRNNNWKGGITGGRHKEMNGYKYVAWRESVFKRDNYTCQICFIQDVKVHADHIERWADNEELRYEVSNGRTLCVPCHYYVTFKRVMPADSRWGTARQRRLN